jgi:hypothetical protein
MKPKAAKKSGGGYDNCGTPTYALYPLIPYLGGKTIWESAEGEGFISTAFRDFGWKVFGSDINQGEDFDFLKTSLAYSMWDVQVTNPPFSLKYKWLEQSYATGKPFALLLPVETLGAQAAQKLFKKNGMELIVLSQRVNFKMPVKGWDCQAQFPVAWFTWGLEIGEKITYATINNKADPLAPLDDSEMMYV